MNQDWTGNHTAIYATIGASNHSDKERQKYDYYATDPKAAELLLKEERFAHTIWECACGEGHLSKVFESFGYDVISTDIVYRGYGEPQSIDFLKVNIKDLDRDIITNPPYIL